MKWAIAADKISKHFGRVKALREVSFALPPGELVALAGPNGAGKTTLLKLTLGLVRPSRGTIQNSRRGSSGMLAHDPAPAGLSAGERCLQRCIDGPRDAFVLRTAQKRADRSLAQPA